LLNLSTSVIIASLTVIKEGNFQDIIFGDLFGEKTPIKFWLVASLDKTIRFWN